MALKLAPMAALFALTVLGGAATAGTKKPAGKHLLVVTWTTGFRHADTIGTPDKDGPAQGILKEMGEKSGVFDVDYCRTQDDVKSMLTADGLKKYDGVIFANTTGNLGIPDLHAFLDWIKAGHAFIGTHSAGDTYHPKDVKDSAGQPDSGYIDMIGCEFRTHGAQAEVDCIVEDGRHPAGAPLTPDFKVKDEIYHFEIINRPVVHVILALKVQGMDNVKDKAGVDGSGKPTDMLISWCKRYGQGRVFYTALGHRPDVWANPKYQEHLLGGIKWALGLVRGSARPGGSASSR